MADRRVPVPAAGGGFAMLDSMDKRILVVEDQRDIAELIAMHLRDLGHRVDCVHDGASGFDAARSGRYDLVVLDVMLPGRDGLDIVRALRMDKVTTPVLMLTARSTEIDRVLGLELGADDYLTKPFSMAELLARVKALLRRAELLRAAQAAPVAAQAVRNGDLEIMPVRREVRVAGLVVEFTALEFDLLLHFASHPGRVFSRTQLLDSVWGYSHEGYEHTVTTHINRLRAKVEQDPMRPRFILTVRGAGYKMRDAP